MRAARLLLVVLVCAAPGAYAEDIINEKPPAPHVSKAPARRSSTPAGAKDAKAPPKPASGALSLPVPRLEANAPSQAPDFPALGQAKAAGIGGACLDGLMRLLPATIDAPHEVFSFWSKTNADRHLFGSIAGLQYTQTAAPRAASIVAALPNEERVCEGIGVQIVPTARACGTVQAALLRNAHALTTLVGLPLIESDLGQRMLLVPTAGNGCVVIAVNQLQIPPSRQIPANLPPQHDGGSGPEVRK